MQIVQYVHRSGEGLPAHAKVTEISQATAEAVRPQIHAAADALINDIKSGWLPASATAQEELVQAEAKVKSAEEALAAAQRDLGAAKQAAAEAAAEEAEEASATAEAAAATEPTAATLTPRAPAESTGAAGEKNGPLPDDFPGHAALAEAGIKTYAQLRKYGDVTDVPRIGAATEAKIKAAM